MKNKFIVHFLLITFLIGLTLQQDSGFSPSTETRVYNVGQSFTTRATNGKVFNAIKIAELKSKYFFIHLQPGIDSVNIPMQMFIYQEGVSQPLKSCIGQDIDSCYLLKEQLKENSQLLVLTSSQTAMYDFTLSTYWSDLQHLVPGTSTKFFFDKKDQTQFYHLELDNTDFYELRISMRPQTIRSAFDKVKIYGKYGKDSRPSAKDYDFKSIHLWQQSQGIFLYGKQVLQKQMTLLIIGEIETIYILSCQIIEDNHHDIKLNQLVNEYLEPGEDFTYHAEFYTNESKVLDFDQYVFTVSGYSGKLNFGFFSDKEQKHSIDIQPFEYLSDAQFLFKKKDIIAKMKDGLYIYVHALERKSVYSLKFYGRNFSTAIQLQENVYQFLQILPKQEQIAYFQDFEWLNDTRRGPIQYSISLTNIRGDHVLQFYQCKQTLDKCFDSKKNKDLLTDIPHDLSSIGSKLTYRLNVDRSQFQQLNVVEKSLTIVMKIKNRENKAKNFSVAAVEYRKENKVQVLREGRPVETKIKPEQFKIFKYTNQDPFIKEIKVYMNQIAGNVQVSSLRGQPNELNPSGIPENSSTITFKQNLSSLPMYIIVQGKQQSIFSIQLVVIHKSEDSISTITLTEDVSFSLKIKAQGYQIVQAVPIFNSVFFEYQSSGSIVVCALSNTQSSNNCQKGFRPTLQTKGQINFPQFNSRTQLFKIMNPSRQQAVKVDMIFHSRDFSHCELKQIGVLYYQGIDRKEISQNGKGFQNNCVSFNILDKKSDLQISLSRVDLGEIHYVISICSQIYTSNSQISSDRLHITRSKIAHACNGSQQYLVIMFSPHKEQHQQNKMVLPFKIKYLVQYSQQKAITIPDGISYDFQAKTTQGPVKVFFYDILNKKNTTIKLIQSLGYGSFSAYIVRTSHKEDFVDSSNYDYSFSKTDGFFLNPSLTITKEQLLQKDCEQCSIIIKVYSIGNVGSKVHFGLQVTQNHIKLEDSSPKDSFLTKGSLDYYQFTTMQYKINSSLLIQVSDNSRQCANIYLSDLDYPDSKDNIAKQQGNQLLYEKAQAGKKYFISVQATDDCPYSISVSNTRIPITKLRRGFNSYMQLKSGEVKYFMIQHIQRREFKILSILDKGQTYFYMNKTTAHDIENIILLKGNQQKSDKIDYTSFQIQGQYPNRIVLHQNNSYLVENSYYIIAVEAKSDMKGYLFYGDSETSLQIVTNTTINDYLSSQGEVFKGKFYGQGKFKLQVTVIVGQLNVKWQKDDMRVNQSQLTKTFQQSQQKYQFEFELTSTGQSYFLSDPAIFTFKAMRQSTVYSFKFIKLQQSSTGSISEGKESIFQIQAGQPNYQYLDKLIKNHQIKGTLNKNNQEILYTVHIDHKDQLHKVNVKGFLYDEDKKQVQTAVNLTIVRNVMKINFVDVKFKSGQSSIDYKLQITTQNSLMLTAYQSSGVNLLPHDTDILVQGQKDFVLYPQGSLLLDVFQCKGKADILYSKTKSALDKVERKTLDMLGMPNQPHAIKIINPGTTFLRISSPRSYVRWLPMDSNKQKGMGYLNYQIGTTKYQGSLLYLTVEWEAVSAKRQTKTSIKGANYIIIIGNSSETVDQAINCENYESSSLLYFSYKTQNINNQQLLKLDLSKIDIIQKYSQNQNLFMRIIAQVQIAVPSEKDQQEQNQHYRFIYSQQQIPLQVFKDIAVSQNDIYILIAAGAGALLLFSLTLLLCIRKICPLIQRLKQGNMMVEQAQDRQFDVVPPSSDRNQVTGNDALQAAQVAPTQEQMN